MHLTGPCSMRFFRIVLLTLSLITLLVSFVWSQTMPATQVVLLGTGTPNADPDRSGPAVAIVVNDKPYLIDFGPGVVRRAAAAARHGIKGLEVKNLEIAFATHLHSDHTLGYADLIFSPCWKEKRRWWSMARSASKP